ncbi:hypothetical protein NUW58_g5934 [Xylaria curta]|uniref:Uncharacterized protein n=1 Tax=Xylaria curta TaxID=42375 RepID=A0ACC1NZE2_9PEZI|nr:hypothetical protein NUW58_g5934 [Xylaria curta]
MDLQPQTVQQCTPTLQPVRDALRQQELSEERVEEIVQEVTELLVQATVQLSLMKGQKMLLASDERQHIGQRIEHFLNFTFGSITAANVRRQQRQEGLGGLDPFSLVFCGLSYKCKDIENMKQDHFDFLIDYIPSFVQRNGLSIHLSRPDISGKVMGHAHRESVNPALSQAFFTSYLDATYKHRKPNAASNALSAVADNLNTVRQKRR